MRRILLVATLLLQGTLAGQERTTPIPLPLERDSLWQFHVAMSRYARAQQTLLSPSSLNDLVAARFAIGDAAGALQLARGLVDATPAELTRGLAAILQETAGIRDDTRTRDELAAFVAAIRNRVARLPVADGAEAAVSLLSLERRIDLGNDSAHQQRVSAFLARYAGTPAAAEFEVAQVEVNRGIYDPDANLRRFRELAQKYDRTSAGAKALYLLGFRIGHPAIVKDPLAARLIEVFDIVDQLESGRFPKSRWVDDAPELILDFFYGVDGPSVSAEAGRILYPRYLEFVRRHRSLRDRYDRQRGAGYMLTTIVSRLGESGDRNANMKRFFDDLGKTSYGFEEAELLRGSYYGFSDALIPLMDSARPEIASTALAIAAADGLGARRYAAVLPRYEQLGQRFANSDWSWVARFRLAQIIEATQGSPALQRYEALTRESGMPPPISMLANIAAGELLESQRDYREAAAHYRAAAAIWQNLPEGRILPRPNDLDRPLALTRFSNLTRADLSTRVERMSKAVSTEETLLYEGRRDYESSKFANAIAALQPLVDRYPNSTAAIEGRRVLRSAKLAAILSKPDLDRAIADQELAALGEGDYDDVTVLSKLARTAFQLRRDSSILPLQGRTERRDDIGVETIIKEALEQWHAGQTVPTPQTPLERDVAAIRAEVFGLHGTPPPFVIVRRDIRVKTPDGIEQVVSVSFTPKTQARVLYASPETLTSMQNMLDLIGGGQVAQLWLKFFPLERTGGLVKPGWIVTTLPSISTITFDRVDHALVPFSNTDRGGTMAFARENGVWVSKGIVSVWVS